MGICGVYQRDGSPANFSFVHQLCRLMKPWEISGGKARVEGSTALGGGYIALENGAMFAGAGRIDNRKELLEVCRVSKNESISMPDSELLCRCYYKLGETVVNQIYGDWSFAAWHPTERRLVLARDHFGNTALYYYADPRIFVFASSRRAILSLNLAPVEIDELYLAQLLVSWSAYHGERTIHFPIKRLPPAHFLTVTPERLETRCYWRLEDTAELNLPRRRDYAEAFREIFEQAVVARLRLPDMSGAGDTGGIAVSLSGGLDSGSVAITAARLLRAENKRLYAFTSVPMADSRDYLNKRNFGDEFSLAQATAQAAGTIDLFPIAAANVSPIQAIRRQLEINGEPGHAAANFFWIQDIMIKVHEQGCRVLLTGQAGNAGISWSGDVFSQSLVLQLRLLKLRNWMKEMMKHHAPESILKIYHTLRYPTTSYWKFSSIHPEFANRLQLRELMMAATDRLTYTAMEKRFAILKPGRNFIGALAAEKNAVYGVDTRDPTADARVLAFTFSVPDRIFIDPETGCDRWLIREAMRGQLPDEVRLNRNRGRQSADLVPRLRICAGEVDEALGELAGGPASTYLDVPYMRRVWDIIRVQNSPESYRLAVTVLTRGIMAGIFINNFFESVDDK